MNSIPNSQMLDIATSTETVPYIDKTTVIKDLSKTPIANLPNELLHDIFCVLQSDTGAVTLDRGHGPWVLEQVCKHWKNIVDTAPLMWQDLVICIPEYNTPRPVERRPEQVATMFRRSKNLPVQVNFVCTSKTADGILPDFIFAIGSHIARYGHQFHKKLVLRVPRDLLDFMDESMTSPERVQDLDIRCEMPLDVIQDRPIRCFEKTQLHTIYLSNVDTDDLLIDWSHATTLTSTQSGSDDLFALQDASSLVHYKHFSFSLDEAIPRDDYAQLESVRTIEIGGHPCHDTQLILPNLEAATFSVYDFCSLIPIVALFQRSHCGALRTLSLSGQFSLNTDLLLVLAALPNLEELSFKYLHFSEYDHRQVDDDASTDMLMVSLTDTPASKCLVPNLKTFELDMSAGDIYFDWELTRIMWESRQKGLEADTEENPHRVVKLEYFVCR